MKPSRCARAVGVLWAAGVLLLATGCTIRMTEQGLDVTGNGPVPPPGGGPVPPGPPPAVACTSSHRIQLLDLDMQPDPVLPGQQVRLWTVRLRSLHNEQCIADLTIYDRNQVAGVSRGVHIRPGVHAVGVQAWQGYQFQQGDRCFVVRANIRGNQIPVDAQRQFCAQYRFPSRWTMNP